MRTRKMLGYDPRVTKRSAKRLAPSSDSSRPTTRISAPAGQAIVLGRIGYDLYSEDIGTPLDRVRHFRAGLGGSTANIAVGLARLGWHVIMLAAVSDDAIGRFVTAELAAEGVDVSAVQPVRGHNTSLALTEISPPAGAEQVFYRCRPADTEVTWDRNMASLLSRPSGAHVPTLFVSNGTSLSTASSRAVTTRALRAARAAGMTTILDVDYRASSWNSPDRAGAACRAVWPYTDILLANDGEMRLLGSRLKRRAHLEESVAANALDQGIQIVVWKRGASGSVGFSAQGKSAAPPAPVTVVSTNGAGDGFAAGFLTAYGRGLDLADCLRYGSAGAACTVSHTGCAEAMPRPDDLEKWFKLVPRSSSSKLS